MPKLIKDNAIVEDSWQTLAATDAPESAEVPESPTLIPLNVWQVQKQQLSNRLDTLGVWLNSDELAEELGEDAKQLPVIALNFPGFMDGRGFSAARLLRERYGFTGELRAMGAIIRDQLFFLQRVGFNSFAMDNSIDLTAALASLSDFSEVYQASSDQPLPLFRRRA